MRLFTIINNIHQISAKINKNQSTINKKIKGNNKDKHENK